MSRKKPEQIFDARLGKPVVVVARVPGCELLVGLKNRPLSERQMNKVARAIVAQVEKRGVDRVKLGATLIRLGRKVKGAPAWRV